jgi:hypothetical protein
MLRVPSRSFSQALHLMNKRRRINKIIFFAFAFLFCSVSRGQKDSVAIGRIKVTRLSDTIYVKVLTDWRVSRNNGQANLSNTLFSRREYKFVETSSLSADRHEDIPPSPKGADEIFDFNTYFKMHPATRNIRLRKGESDIVTYYVTVNRFGRVRFTDSKPVERLGDTMVVYTDVLKTKYKIDVVHVKTKLAFNDLAKKRWKSAKIKILKKHPSKHRRKYKQYRGFTKGTIQVVYSSIPFKE